MTTLSARQFANPTRYVDGPHTDPDPFVLRFRGRYYCYSTDEHQVNVSVSDDMVTWERLAPALQVPGRAHYWAPCAIYADGQFHLYFSNRPAESDDPHDEVLQHAVSDRPEGPFTVTTQFFDTFSIDPHVVPDGAGGYVMFYAVNDVTGLDDDYVGTSIVADRLLDFQTLEGKPRVIVRPSLDEEIFERNRFGDGRDWYTIEGATYVTRHGHAFLTYSGNAYVREDYFIGYARALANGAPHELAWEKYPSASEYAPLVRRSEHVEGTGHNSIVRAPNLVDDWIVYHGRDAAQPLLPDVEQRVMRIDALHYSGARMLTAAPTHTPQDAPALPSVHATFDERELPACIDVLQGRATSGGGALSTDPAHVTAAVVDHTTDAYVAETYLRVDLADRGARAGVIVSWTGPDDFVEGIVDTFSSTLTCREWRGGVCTVLGRADLSGLDVTQWQRVEITRALTTATVTLGDKVRITVPVPAGAGTFGLVSWRTSAQFSAVSLTDHLSLDSYSLGLLGSRLPATPHTVADASGLSASSRSPLLLAGPRGANEAVTLAFRLDSPHASVVATPWIGDDHHLSVHVSRTESTIRLTRAGRDVHTDVVPYGKEEQNVTLRVAVLADRATVSVNGVTRHLEIAPSTHPRQSYELTGATLTSFDQTAISDPPYRNRIAKEHV